MIAPKTSYRRAPLSRRMLLLALSFSAIGAGLGLTALPVLAETKGPTEVPVEELMKPGPMGEITLGKPDAKVTIVEYASMTCGHCAHFTKEIWPELKKKYVDPGKAITFSASSRSTTSLPQQRCSRAALAATKPCRSSR